jgi:5-methylcytosine-specific restriction protein A
MALRVCSKPGCPHLTEGGRCPPCRAEAEQARGTSTQRGYDHAHRTEFRGAVLQAQPLCVCTDTAHGHGTPCGALSHHADHHPRGRDELVRLALNPNDPAYGRGLCQPCHSSHTSQAQPGGWNIR